MARDDRKSGSGPPDGTRPADEFGGKQKSTQNDTGLSFEAEPTNLERSASPEREPRESDPGRTSPRADFVPGEPTKGENPFFTSGFARGLAVVAILAVLIAIGFWLF